MLNYYLLNKCHIESVNSLWKNNYNIIIPYYDKCRKNSRSSKISLSRFAKSSRDLHHINH